MRSVADAEDSLNQRSAQSDSTARLCRICPTRRPRSELARAAGTGAGPHDDALLERLAASVKLFTRKGSISVNRHTTPNFQRSKPCIEISRKAGCHFGSMMVPMHPTASISDPLTRARRLAAAKVYACASADYPGATTSLVFDSNGTTAVGVFVFDPSSSASPTSAFTFAEGSYQSLTLDGGIG